MAHPRTTRIALSAALAFVSATAACAQQGGVDGRPPNATGQTPAFAGQTRAPENKGRRPFTSSPSRRAW